MCTNCWTNSVHQAKIPSSPEAGSSKTSENTPEYEAEYSFHQQSLESVFEEMEGISPLKKSRTMNKAKRSTYGKRKAKQLEGAIKKKVAKALNVSQEEFASSDEKSCSNCDDFHKLITELKDKFKSASRQEKIKLLTLVPESWSKKRVCEEFNVSEYLVRASRKLKIGVGYMR